MDSSQHKGISTVIRKYVVLPQSFGCSHGNEPQKSQVGWFLGTGGLIYSIFGLSILLI